MPRWDYALTNRGPDLKHFAGYAGEGVRIASGLGGGLGTGDAVTRGCSLKPDDAVEVGGSVNRARVTNGGPSVRIDSYHPDETSQVRQRDSAPRYAARPVGVPLSDLMRAARPAIDEAPEWDDDNERPQCSRPSGRRFAPLDLVSFDRRGRAFAHSGKERATLWNSGSSDLGVSSGR